jgi:hypothetical protein
MAAESDLFLKKDMLVAVFVQIAHYIGLRIINESVQASTDLVVFIVAFIRLMTCCAAMQKRPRKVLNRYHALSPF